MSFIEPLGKHIRKTITEKQVLEVWKEFFDLRENWRDLAKKNQTNMTYLDFKDTTDAQHLAKIKDQPVKFLLKSESEFFQRTDEGVLELNDSLDPWLDDSLFIEYILNCLEYRIESYYFKKGYLTSRENTLN